MTERREVCGNIGREEMFGGFGESIVFFVHFFYSDAVGEAFLA